MTKTKSFWVQKRSAAEPLETSKWLGLENEAANLLSLVHSHTKPAVSRAGEPDLEQLKIRHFGHGWYSLTLACQAHFPLLMDAPFSLHHEGLQHLGTLCMASSPRLPCCGDPRLRWGCSQWQDRVRHVDQGWKGRRQFFTSPSLFSHTKAAVPCSLFLPQPCSDSSGHGGSLLPKITGRR